MDTQSTRCVENEDTLYIHGDNIEAITAELLHHTYQKPVKLRVELESDGTAIVSTSNSKPLVDYFTSFLSCVKASLSVCNFTESLLLDYNDDGCLCEVSQDKAAIVVSCRYIERKDQFYCDIVCQQLNTLNDLQRLLAEVVSTFTLAVSQSGEKKKVRFSFTTAKANLNKAM